MGKFLSRRLCVDVDTGCEYICRINKFKFCLSSVHEAAEHVVEILPDLVVCIKEHLRRLCLDFFAYAHKILKGLLCVVVACLLALVAFLLFSKLLDGHEVYLSQILNLLFCFSKFLTDDLNGSCDLVHAFLKFHEVA